MMKLIELEEEIYDTSLANHYTQPRMEFHSRKEMDRILDLPLIDRDDLTALIIAESYMVAKGDDSALAVVWKDWDETSPPPVDVAKIAGVRMRIPWDYYGQAYNEVYEYLEIDKENPDIKIGEGWPYTGWQKLVYRSQRFKDLRMLTVHDHYGSISPVLGHKGVVYLPQRSVAVVTNSSTPMALVV